MAIPMIIVACSQDDEFDVDSVITFGDEDSVTSFSEDDSNTKWEEGVTPSPPSLRRCVTPPEIPQRRSSEQTPPIYLVAGDGDNEDPSMHPREIEMSESARSSHQPSLPQRRTTLISGDSIIENIEMLSGSFDQGDDENDMDHMISDRENMRRSSQMEPPRQPQRQNSAGSQDGMEKLVEALVERFALEHTGATIEPRISSARSA